MNLRTTVCISADSPEELASFENWIEVWKGKMKYVSGNYGCGCCVHLFDLEGPKEAIESIPEKIRSTSDWTEKGVKVGNPEHDIVPDETEDGGRTSQQSQRRESVRLPSFRDVPPWLT